MKLEVGMTLYRYTVRGGRLTVREGVINNYGLRTCVNFKDGGAAVRCPRAEDIGVMKNVGHSIWMTCRDDEAARKIYIDFEEKRIAELEDLLDRKRRAVAMLEICEVSVEC